MMGLSSPQIPDPIPESQESKIEPRSPVAFSKGGLELEYIGQASNLAWIARGPL